jgi:glycosyltransferase involved in cell wall biosynthesis/flagellin-specific chaperone FliS
VKNEEKFLSKCLSSLKDVADEIIVVDTGSTDRTVEIARQFTDLIYFYEWDNNFANARNESMKHAKGDYILIIDADEYFDENDKFELRLYLENNEIAGGFLKVINYAGEIGRRVDILPVMLFRIIRNGFYYTDAIHEQIDPKIFVDKYPVKHLPATLHHLGYLSQIIAAKHKSERNLDILNDLLAKNPDDIFQRINLAAEYMVLQQPERVLELTQKNYEEFDIINKLINGTASSSRIHLVARNYKFYISTLINLQRPREAIKIAEEAHSIIPMVTDYMYLMGVAYYFLSDLLRAKYWFNQCLIQGDMKVSLYDPIVGSGSYLTHLELGKVWTTLGDDQLALHHYFQAFIGKPMIAHIVVFYLIYLIPNDELFLKEQIENKISDVITYHTYAEAYVNSGRPKAQRVIERAEERYGRTALTIRARGTLILSEDSLQYPAYLESNENPEYDQIIQQWLGFYYLNLENYDAAEAAFHKAGEVGESLWNTVGMMIIQGLPPTTPIAPYIRDLVAIKAERLLRLWLPHAPDSAEAWIFIHYSPYHHLLEQIEWPGDTVSQCEQNAIREFKAKNFNQAQEWLIKSLDFPPTVMKILIEVDLALVKNDRQYAVKLLAYGKLLFEESIAINNALTQLAGSTDAMAILFPRGKTYRLEDLLMNPYDAYKKNVVDTMPLNIQLAQLHARGAALTRQVKTDAEKGDIMAARARIQELEEFLTFLRSSLDPRLEISVQTDETYLFYYKMLIRWFLAPKEIPEEYDAFIEFWESWAKTWAKAQVK